MAIRAANGGTPDLAIATSRYFTLCRIVAGIKARLDPGATFEQRHEAFLEGGSKPSRAVVTTPNSEYDVVLESLPAFKMRHRYHRFEWRRDEFQKLAGKIADRFGYNGCFSPVGPEHAEVGSPA